MGSFRKASSIWLLEVEYFAIQLPYNLGCCSETVSKDGIFLTIITSAHKASMIHSSSLLHIP